MKSNENVHLVTVSDDRSGRKGGLYGVTQDKMQRILQPGFPGMPQYHFTYDEVTRTRFYYDNEAMISQVDPDKNGRLYKPFVIRQALSWLPEGDFLLYSDCSPEMWDMKEGEFVIGEEEYSLSVIKGLTERNRDFLTAFVKWDDKQIFAGELGQHTHDKFTLESCLDIMGGEPFRYSYQCASGMICLRKTRETEDLVDEWLRFNRIKECSCTNVEETEDSYHDGVPGRKLGNRHDQSVLSLLLNKRDSDYVDIIYNDLNPYNFLNFCRRDTNYEFINSNIKHETRSEIHGETPRLPGLSDA